MSAMASQITRLTSVYSTVYSYQRKQQSFASLAFVGGIRWWPANSPHKGPVTRKMFPLDDVIKSPGELQFQQRMKGNVKEVFGIAMTARFMGLTWGPHGADRTQAYPILAPWNLLSGAICACASALWVQITMSLDDAELKGNWHGSMWKTWRDIFLTFNCPSFYKPKTILNINVRIWQM